MEKTKALSQWRDFEGTIKLTPHVFENINWWINNIHLSYYVIDHGEPRLSYTQMPLQRGGTVNFRELPQGGSGTQLEQNTTLITLRC